jgi:transglutaminase-like putative cysteine protease
VTATSEVQVLPRSATVPNATQAWEDVAAQLQTDRSNQGLEAYQFAFASPRIIPNLDLKNYAECSFSPRRSILESLVDLTERIHQDFNFDQRATTVHTPLQEVFEKRHGVCQDFAHLEIGCLRALGLAARYVSGYLRTLPPPGKPRLIGADASHAWLSVYCGKAGWIDVDPTNNTIPSTDHVTVAWGRDYDDVRPVQGVIVGGGEHRMSVAVDVAPMDVVEDGPVIAT